MSEALRYRRAVVGDFVVSTIITDSHFETRIIRGEDDAVMVPDAVIMHIRNFVFEGLDTFYVEEDGAVSTLAFEDANTAHFAVIDILGGFLDTHTKMVTYVPNV